MSDTTSGPLTALLAAAADGDAVAREQVWRTVEDELRSLAHAQMRREPARDVLQTTVLVTEAYLRLVHDGTVAWANRRHFFAAAANAMRRVRVDYARSYRAQKRGGGAVGRLDPEAAAAASPGVDPDTVLALDEALGRLEHEAPRQAEIVLLRYFAGLSVDETAAALGLSARTVDSDWRMARAWLYRELSKGDTNAGLRSGSARGPGPGR